jgi:glycosyltransferase involved in cell wall biosynthesis
VKLGIVYHMPFWRDDTGALRELEGSFARYVDSLAPYFEEIVLCVPEKRHASGEGTAIRSANVRLAPLPDFAGPLQFYPQLPSALVRIARFVREIDLLHCRVPTPAGIFAFLAAQAARRPAFVLIVGDLRALLPTMPYHGLKRLLWRAYTAFEEWNVQWMADHSVAFANGAALAAKHSRERRAVIQTQTTTIDAREIASREDTCVGPRIRLLTVSRIDPRKGLRILPEVVSLLTGRGLDVSLDIVGPAVGAPGEAEGAAIAASARALGVTDRVQLKGPVPLDALMPLYRQYDLFVLPTLPGEGIPRVLLEAMAAGVPVVATRVSGIPSLIEHQRNGLLVDEPAAAPVVDAIARLAGDGSLRRRIIASGYETARGFTLQAQAARMMQDVSSRLGLTLRQPAVAPAAS